MTTDPPISGSPDSPPPVSGPTDPPVSGVPLDSKFPDSQDFDPSGPPDAVLNKQR